MPPKDTYVYVSTANFSQSHQTCIYLHKIPMIRKVKVQNIIIL